MDWIPPVFIYFLGAAVVPFLRGNRLKAWLLFVPVLAFIDVLWIYLGRTIYYGNSYFSFEIAGLVLTLGRVDALAMVFAFIFVIVSFIGNLYALHVKNWDEHAAALLYAGSAIGIAFAFDLITLFVFWEVLAWSSVVLIWRGGRRESTHAGLRYLLVHNTGGALLLAGIVMVISQTGSTQFSREILAGGGLASTLILFGFLINAAATPLHAWLTDSYPESSITGIIFLNAFTTKTAIYVLIRGFHGAEILIWVGAIMTIYGVVYAILENDMRRLLSYHIVCQLGYMVCGIGVGSAIALNGAAAHAVTNILFKGLLLMSVGSVIHMTGKYKLTELGGLYRTMPKALILYMVGAFAISSVPFFNGFVSKSLIIEGVAAKELATVWAMIIIASAGTFLSVGLKLPYLAFFGKDKDIMVDEREVPKNMLFAMGITAFLCIFIGVYPNSLYMFLQHQPVGFTPYTFGHVVNEIAFLLFVALVFFVFVGSIKAKPTINLDTDWFYRKAGNFILRAFNYQLSQLSKWVENVFLKLGVKSLNLSYNPAIWFSTNILRTDKRREYPNIYFHMDILGPTAVLAVLYSIIAVISILWLWGGVA